MVGTSVASLVAVGVLIDAIVVDVVLDLIVAQVQVAVVAGVVVHFAELIDCLVWFSFSLLMRYSGLISFQFSTCVCKKLKKIRYMGWMTVILRTVEDC